MGSRMTARAARRMTTEIPMTFRTRGGRTVMVLPDCSRAVERREAIIDTTMVKVIARAFRWRHLLLEGTYNTMDDLAKAEKINPSYISRMIRLAYLSPAIVEAILDGRHPAPGASDDEGSDGTIPARLGGAAAAFLRA